MHRSGRLAPGGPIADPWVPRRQRCCQGHARRQGSPRSRGTGHAKAFRELHAVVLANVGAAYRRARTASLGGNAPTEATILTTDEKLDSGALFPSFRQIV